MKKDIILCGVGGQGILSIATIIGEAATEAGINLKQAEVHGMSQRGGDVQSNLRLSTENIYSDLIPQGGADVVISMETAVKQAHIYGHSLEREVGFLTVHSMLHLLGYDHENGGIEQVHMREKEEEVLTKIGLKRDNSYYMGE